MAPNLRVPVTAVLLIEGGPQAVAGVRLEARIELYPPAGPEEITIAGRTVPLEVEPTAALAYGLADAPIWATEYQGFLFGALFTRLPSRLYALQPHQPGRFPVVLVHGTALARRLSSSKGSISSTSSVTPGFVQHLQRVRYRNVLPASRAG